MNAGPEMDALVAKEVMGWTPVENYGSYTGFWDKDGEYGSSDNVVFEDEIPAYSRSIAAAWDVVEKRFAEHHVSLGRVFPLIPTPDGWSCEIANMGSLWADTAPHAICLAALRAVGVDV